MLSRPLDRHWMLSLVFPHVSCAFRFDPRPLGIARHSVCSWKQLLGVTVLAHARAFYNDQYTQLHAARLAEVRGPSRAGWTWEVHALRGVASNSNIQQGSKAHVCLFHHALDTDDSGADGDHDRPFHRTYCDLVKIEGSCDGPHQPRFLAEAGAEHRRAHVETGSPRCGLRGG